MSKIIKKQIKRSLPLFLIFSLVLSSTLAGLIFNIGFQIKKADDNKLSLSLEIPKAEAQDDTASTTVEVRNAPPAIVTDEEPYEVPVSTSTSPINVGASISFKTTATDAESNDYFLIVCSSAGVSAHDSAPPTCTGGASATFCVSASTTPGNEATCTDSAMAEYGTEEVAWYAYVCDGHATQSDCSEVSQGKGGDEDASPLYVNHAPDLDAISTTVDNQEPGGTFEFTATTTETDIQGGADDVVLHICRTESFSTTTGCDPGQYLCSATSTAVANEAVVSCSWTDTAPTADQAYNYYAYIKDSHELGGDTGQGTMANYTIINVRPSVSNIDINEGNDITVNMKGVAEVEVVLTADITDNNEATIGEVSVASSSLYWSGVANGLECVADDSDCYRLTAGDCEISNRVGASANVTCTTTMAYYAVPTDAGNDNDNAATNWLAGFSVIDNNNLYYASTTDSGNGVEVNQTLALDISENSISYAVVKGGQNTGNYNATTTVVNYGNTPLDTNVEGTDMVHTVIPGEEIHDNNQKFGLSADNYTLLTYNLSSTTPELVDVVIPRATSTNDVLDEIYWGIGIPNGTVSGNYEGENTFTALTDNNGDWN